MKLYSLVLLLAAVGGCSEVSSELISSGSDKSNLLAVKPGMTESRVTTLLGEHQNEAFDAADGSTSCRSYLYGLSPDVRYVHVYYYHMRVWSTSDGHEEPCGFGGDIV